MSVGQEPLLSVIVANRNKCSYLPDCLNSVLHQNYANFEIVIYDDDSNDDSLAILGDYQRRFRQRIRILSGRDCCGPALARHRAILASAGEYLVTLDSDDYYIDPDKLKAEVALVLAHKRGEGRDVIAFSNIVWVDGDCRRLGVWGNSDTVREGDLFDVILSRSHMIPRDFVVKREQYHAVGGFDGGISHYEDWDLKIRLARKFEFCYTGLEGTAYRRHGSGLSSIPPSEHVRHLRSVFTKNIGLEADESRRRIIIDDFERFLARLERR